MTRVIDLLKRLFPLDHTSGAPYLHLQPKRGPKDPYLNPPLLPFDVFAIAAHLIELSGAYHHITPRSMDPDGKDGAPQSGKSNRRIEVTNADITFCRKAANAWRKSPPPGDKRNQGALQSTAVADLWAELFSKHGACPVFAPLKPDDAPPDWWLLAHKLLMIADEACEGVGFNPPDTVDKSFERPWFEQLVLSRFAYSYVKSHVPYVEGYVPYDEGYVPGLKTLSAADPNTVCVLPKCRTTPVGCTLRSLSHHLALLPPQGVARARWYPPQPGEMPLDDTELNVLLVPFPFDISASSFSGSAARADVGNNWGYFRVNQTWLPDPQDATATLAFVQRLEIFICNLVSEATKKLSARSIDVIVLPELAINSAVYEELLIRLLQRLPKLELFVAGVSDFEDRKGNYVAVTALSELEDFPFTVVREKHHRWKLDYRQISDYALTSALNPKFEWWEDIELLSRRVDFTAFRRRSVLAAMICEDLARVDPCQELLRAIGPNLVIALLMDAPQLPVRWPGRYATILAEDPGCSVLTLTSKALMQRQHRRGSPKSNGPDDRVIGLWRDDFHRENKPLCCPDGHYGVWLKLWSAQSMDTTIDGRINNKGKTWIYGGHKPIELAQPPDLTPYSSSSKPRQTSRF